MPRAAALIGGEAGLGRGFYFQMAGFENGRLQTAARAVGLMQAAFEAGMAYAQDRKVFGSPVFEYQLARRFSARASASGSPRLRATATPRSRYSRVRA